MARKPLRATPTDGSTIPLDSALRNADDNFIELYAWGGGGEGGAVASVNGETGVVVLDKSDIGLGNVDNTSDANKPVSSATVTALALKAPLASPTFTGTPSAPTAAGGTNTTQLATTAFVRSEVAALADAAPAALDTLNELAAALGDDANFSTTVTNALAGKQPLATSLTSFAGLTPSVDDILQFKGTEWANRTIAQVKADLTALAGSWTFSGASAGANSVTITGTGLGSNAALMIASTSPCLTWDDTDAGSNGRRWNARAANASFIFEAINSADAGQKQFLHVQRTSGASDITLMIYGNTTDSPPHSFRGDIRADVAGKGFQIKEGSNARMGVVTLVDGAAVVSNTSVTANTRIYLTSQVDGGAPGFLRVSARTAATSFTITSSSGTDTSTVAWQLVEPAP